MKIQVVLPQEKPPWQAPAVHLENASCNRFRGVDETMCDLHSLEQKGLSEGSVRPSPPSQLQLLSKPHAGKRAVNPKEEGFSRVFCAIPVSL